MFKLTDAADLEKAGRSIGAFFAKRVQDLEKTHALHAAVAAHHDAMKAQHTTTAAQYKAHHDGLPNEDVHKAHFAHGHTHHTAMAAHHEAIAKAHADHAATLKTEVDAMKSMAAEWNGDAKPGAASSLFARSAAASGTPLSTPSGNPFEDMVKETTAQLAKKTLETFDNDDEVKQFMRETIMKMVGEAIGNTIVPTGVSAVTPNRPGISAVPRGGQPTPAAKPNVPDQFQKLVAIDDEELTRPVL